MHKKNKKYKVNIKKTIATSLDTPTNMQLQKAFFRNQCEQDTLQTELEKQYPQTGGQHKKQSNYAEIKHLTSPWLFCKSRYRYDENFSATISTARPLVFPTSHSITISFLFGCTILHMGTDDKNKLRQRIKNEKHKCRQKRQTNLHKASTASHQMKKVK